MKIKRYTMIRSQISSPRFVPNRTDRRSPRPPIQLKQWVPRSAARRRLQRRRLNLIPYPCPAARLLLASYACQHSRESGTSLFYNSSSGVTLVPLLPFVISHIPQTNMTYPSPLTHTDYNLTSSISHDFLDTYPLNPVLYWEFKAG